MHFTKALPLAATLLSLAAAELDFDGEDVPAQCVQVCDPIRTLVSQCNVDDDLVGGDAQEDNLERQCVCTNKTFDVASVAGLCASCMEQNVRERDDMEDINEVMWACSFTSTSFAPGATTAVQGITVSASKVTDVAQLTTTVGPRQTNDNNNNNNDDGNNNDNQGDEGGAGAALGVPSALVYLAGAMVAGGMMLQ